MNTGTVEAIFITETPAAPMRSVTEVRAIAGIGLEGDRLARAETAVDPHRQITLIEAEAIEAVNRDDGVTLSPDETRRNLVTRNVPLNHLVGRQFTVGEVTLRGIRLCEPCAHLERLTRTGVRSALIHRGGLRSEILSGGVLRVGDPVTEL